MNMTLHHKWRLTAGCTTTNLSVFSCSPILLQHPHNPISSSPTVSVVRPFVPGLCSAIRTHPESYLVESGAPGGILGVRKRAEGRWVSHARENRSAPGEAFVEIKVGNLHTENPHWEGLLSDEIGRCVERKLELVL